VALINPVKGATVQLERILQEAVQQGISDVLLKDGSPPLFRLRGEFVPMEDAQPLTSQELQAALTRFLVEDAQRMRFLTERCADLAFGEPDLGRFRINAYRQRGKVAIAVRVIPATIPEFRDLNLPPVVERLANERRGMILVTGPTGSGKTTTLAAMIGHINRQSARHIITIEDPIEYVHQDERAVICQREIGADVDSFAAALRVALRQIPDVIMLGEMRDPEAMETALQAAETGHLVLSTLHTIDVPETISRIVSSFPEYKRDQVRVVLANVIKGVVCQRLVPTVNGTGMVPAVEVMVSSARVRDYIEANRIRDLHQVMEQGQVYGMQTFDQSLLSLVQANLIATEEALQHCTSPADFERAARGLDVAKFETLSTSDEQR
jgi:twitching motility protein PilT